jgi:diguanylate cyclase (GGDEF)-like protein
MHSGFCLGGNSAVRFFEGILQEMTAPWDHDAVLTALMNHAAGVVERQRCVILIVLIQRGLQSVLGRWYGVSRGVVLNRRGEDLLIKRNPLRRSETALTWDVLDVLEGTQRDWVHQVDGWFVVYEFDNPHVKTGYAQLAEFDPAWSAYIPLRISPNECFGFLVIDSGKPGGYTEREVQEFMLPFSDHMGKYLSALHRAYYDSLMYREGIWGQAYLHDFLSGRVVSEEELKNINLCFFDINNFKGLNDEFGHSAGDEILKRFARMVYSQFADEIGRSAWFFRRGGDEFVLIIKRSAVDQVQEILKSRLFDELRDCPITHNGLNLQGNRSSWSLTVSCGVAQYAEVRELLERAETPLHGLERISEQAMYLSKYLFKAKMFVEPCPLISAPAGVSKMIQNEHGGRLFLPRDDIKCDAHVREQIMKHLSEGKITGILASHLNVE